MCTIKVSNNYKILFYRFFLFFFHFLVMEICFDYAKIISQFACSSFKLLQAYKFFVVSIMIVIWFKHKYAFSWSALQLPWILCNLEENKFTLRISLSLKRYLSTLILYIRNTTNHIKNSIKSAYIVLILPNNRVSVSNVRLLII